MRTGANWARTTGQVLAPRYEAVAISVETPVARNIGGRRGNGFLGAGAEYSILRQIQLASIAIKDTAGSADPVNSVWL